MNKEPSQPQLSKEFDKPPTPELKPDNRQRYDPEKRMLPGRPTFGGGQAARHEELKEQISLEQKRFKAKQKREFSLKKEWLKESQSAERFSIRNERADITERIEKKSQTKAAHMLYHVSGQSAKDQERLVALELKEKALDQEFEQILSQFQHSQEGERLRFGEALELYRNEAEGTITELGREQESTKSQEQARTIQRTEGRDGRCAHHHPYQHK